jgi:hypothetical protein
MSNNKYCPCCGEKKACGRHHVYAIELKRDVLQSKQFRELAGVEEDFDGRCFYVGQTKHQVLCRYTQHKANPFRRRLPGGGFYCGCKTGIKDKVLFNRFNRGNKFVRNFAYPVGLREEYFRHLNPIYGGSEAAKAAEEKLALELRAKGFAVHFA